MKRFLIVLMLLALCAVLPVAMKLLLLADLSPVPFTPILEVQLQDAHTGEITWEAVGLAELTRTTEPFEADTPWTHTFCCFDSYIDSSGSRSRVLNFREDAWLSEDDRAVLAEDPVIDRLLDQVAALEHSIMSAKVIRQDGAYYAVVDFNVNLWWPFKLYRYDPDTDTLTLLCTFDGQDVVALRLLP
ncbi:MAG: hypothetical protein ACI4O7_09060 [Aristaeellaceae bacterium]